MSCLVYGCRNLVSSGELCAPCRAYLHSGVGSHETLMRPKWELVPRLIAIHRALSVSDETIRAAGLMSLGALIETLEKCK